MGQVHNLASYDFTALAGHEIGHEIGTIETGNMVSVALAFLEPGF
jgi:hypothetical protein